MHSFAKLSLGSSHSPSPTIPRRGVSAKPNIMQSLALFGADLSLLGDYEDGTPYRVILIESLNCNNTRISILTFLFPIHRLTGLPDSGVARARPVLTKKQSGQEDAMGGPSLLGPKVHSTKSVPYWATPCDMSVKENARNERNLKPL